MIEIADADVPAHASPLTVEETLDGLRYKTITPEGGDLIIELREPATREVVARMWLGKDGIITPEGLSAFVKGMTKASRYTTRVLWIEKIEQRH